MSQPKFFGWIDYQIFLAIGFCSSALRARVELQNAVKNQQRLPWRKLGESTKPDETITQKLSDANAIAESSQPRMQPPSKGCDGQMEMKQVLTWLTP